jgi:hypothetical protein
VQCALAVVATGVCRHVLTAQAVAEMEREGVI